MRVGPYIVTGERARGLGLAGDGGTWVLLALLGAAAWAAGGLRRNPERTHVVRWYQHGRHIDQWGPMSERAAKAQKTKAEKGADRGDRFVIARVRRKK